MSKAKAKATADKIRKEIKEARDVDEKAMVVADKALAKTYRDDANVGSEEVSTEDVNIPGLKLIQKTSEPDLPEEKILGHYYRTDTQTQHKEVMVNIVCFKKTWGENFNKTGQERKYILFGSYEGSSEVFRLFLRGGWALGAARQFLTEFKMIQSKHRLPMYALKVKLASKEEQGTIKETGRAYTTFRPVINITRDENGNPNVERDLGRAKWLKETATKFALMPVGKGEEVVEDDQGIEEVLGDEEPQ